MSGDIDIEEHDLMDNPRVRTIFPDLTLLKKEIVDDDHEELQKQSIPNTSHRSSMVCHRNQRITNDIVMSHKIKEEKLKLAETKKLKNCLLYSNVLVFGTKSSKRDDKKLKYEVKINLEDINCYLKKSDCYCRICKTLFPKTKMFEEHNTLKHKVNDNNTNRVEVQEKNVKNSQKDSSEESVTKKCFHCKEIFPTQELLIEHIYEVLDKKAKTQKTILDKDSVKSNDLNSQHVSVVHETVEKSKNKAKCTTKSVHTNGTSEEQESSSTVHNQIKLRDNEAFQCHVCSYYFQQSKFYESHMKRKHKTNVAQINVVKFNPKCVFCANSYSNLKRYNEHLHHAHSSLIYYDTNLKKPKLNSVKKNPQTNEDEKNKSLAIQENRPLSLESSYDFINDRLLLFKSVLFKCLKCEIHFLSPKLATSHSIHSEILINWKCSICKIFFKRSDEELHLKQHEFTESFTVANVEDKDFSRILIKCAKCPLHVPKNDFRHHINVCKAIINSWHCLVCDVFIDGNIKRAHNTIHRNMENKKNDFIIINDAIVKTQVHVVQNSESKEEISLRKSTSSDSDNYSPNELNNSLAKTIKSCLNKDNSIVKYKPSINKKTPFVGSSQKLILNDKSDTEDRFVGEPNKFKRKIDEDVDSHSMLRRKLLKYSINDDLYSKFAFEPPKMLRFLLNLTYCKNCECFINIFFKLDVHLDKRCNNVNKRVCHICGIVFTPKLIVRHKEFHKLNPHLKLQDFRFYDIETWEQIVPPIPIYLKCNTCDAYYISKDEIRSHVCIETQSLHCDICSVMFVSEEALNLHVPFHGYCLQSNSPVEHNSLHKGPAASKDNYINLDLLSTESVLEKHNEDDNHTINECEDEMMDVDESSSINNEIYLVSQENNTNDQQDNIEETHYLYECEICNVTVDHYDQLVEHCHSHYNNRYKDISTEECTLCKLKFDSSCILSHKEVHKTCLGNETFETFVCDLFHFGRSNEDWQNHVFKSLPESKRENIIKYAIYKNECRVKLDIAQQGDPELTLYQCAKCSIFIDDFDMFTHREACKGNNKKYPCDQCGIDLSSESHRNRHLKLHEQRSLSKHTYRIVIFNQLIDFTLNDLMFNKANQYVIYKCRNCHGVVEWGLLKCHNCNSKDLKKCKFCGLLIYNKDYVKHETKHKTSDTFICSNMKVVMFGQIREESKENVIACSFSGIASDYVLYRCNKCNVCIRNLRLGSKHFCLIDSAKWKCSKCLLYFDEGKKRGHLAMHLSDTEFTSDAICVIPFDPQETYQRLEKEFKSNSKNSNNKKESEESLTNQSISTQEKTDVLYRCPCGLHYLSEVNAIEHVNRNKCGVISKKNQIQTCSKCNLNFTPDILYKHLLQHHADKYNKYSFDIVNVGGHNMKNEEAAKICLRST